MFIRISLKSWKVLKTFFFFMPCSMMRQWRLKRISEHSDFLKKYVENESKLWFIKKACRITRNEISPHAKNRMDDPYIILPAVKWYIGHRWPIYPLPIVIVFLHCSMSTLLKSLLKCYCLSFQMSIESARGHIWWASTSSTREANKWRGSLVIGWRSCQQTEEQR